MKQQWEEPETKYVQIGDTKIRMATDLEEKLSDMAQPLLEIAEGTRSMDEWNDRLMDLLNVASSELSQAKAERTEEIVGEINEWYKEMYEELKDKPTYDASSSDYGHGILRGFTLLGRYLSLHLKESEKV